MKAVFALSATLALMGPVAAESMGVTGMVGQHREGTGRLIFAQSSPAPPPAAPAQAGPLKGIQAGAALSGNTISGKIDGSDYVIFFNANGSMKMQIDSEVSDAKWALRGEEICFLVEDEDDECYTLAVDGSIAILTDSEGTQYRMKIERGNPHKL